MIITRTPFRVSFAGGGSDLESFYREEPGVVLSAAINKYMYLTVKRRFGSSFRVSYSQTEIREQTAEIEHPIVRESLQMLDITRGLEIVSIADLPARSGMGSSSSFCVGLLHALHAMRSEFTSAEQLAREACHIEIERLREPIGKQDQYIAAYGGIQVLEFLPDGKVLVSPLIIPAETRRELNRRLMLFYTEETRDAREVLERQNQRAAVNRPALGELCGIAREMRQVLTVGNDLNAFGRLLDAAWRLKRGLEGSISNPRVDHCYEEARRAGALGGKLLGAGGGGFLLLYCEPHRQARVSEALEDLVYVPFGFDAQGSKVIYVGEDDE